MKKINSNLHLKEVLRGGFIALVVKLFAAFSAFLMNITIARTLGAEEAGLFFLGFTLVTLLAATGRLGLDQSVVRFIANAEANSNASLIHAVYRKSLTWSLPVCLLIAFIGILLSDSLVDHVFTQHGLRPVLTTLFIGIPLVAFYTLHAQYLQGLKRVGKSMATLGLPVPLLLLAGLLIFPVNTALEVSQLYLFSCIGACVVGFFWWKTSAPPEITKKSFPSSVLRSSCYPLWGVIVLSQCLDWSSQLMLGAWSSASDVAFFAAAQRTAMLTSFVLIAVNSIAAPKFAAMYSQGDLDGLRRVALWASRLMLLAALPALLFMFFFPELLMGLFGSDFKNASTALVILSMGQFVNIATGSVGFLLSMTGHERKLRFNVFIGALLGICLGVMLIPTYGLLGGAIATAIAVASQNLLGVYYVKKLLGFNTLTFWRKI